MEQFSLEKWLQDKSRKVATRDGRPVRIICWDRNTTYWKIIALVTSPDGSTENPYTYDVNGNESDGCLHDHRNNLFFADEEDELTEFEKVVQNILNEPHYQDIQAVKQWSKTLLDLARKEIEEDNVIIGKDKYLKICDQYYNNGKKNALKDLPKWKKATEHKEFDKHVCVMDYYMFPFLDTEVNEGDYYIELSELKKLPKEE